MNGFPVHTYGLSKKGQAKNMTVNIEGLGKITASKYVLSALSLAFSNSATYYMKGNMFFLSEQEENRSNAIHDELSKVGYYDNL